MFVARHAAAGVRGVNATQGPKFDSYTLSIEAAMQGWGVSLGRMGLIETDIAAGRLMVLFTTRLQGRRSWFIVTRHGAARPQVTAFRVFLLREARLRRLNWAPKMGPPA
ncbi:LysR substrate-binding domain-containing protein [Acidiphilium sp. AL]|uniref:LysR substrate-binding domain-containing protein n=1 Tax=Acidiphilium sp. AL TaxID=2871704 RepID=UPI0038CF350D